MLTAPALCSQAQAAQAGASQWGLVPGLVSVQIRASNQHGQGSWAQQCVYSTGVRVSLIIRQVQELWFVESNRLDL